jgi:hypothetical protein
MWYTMVVVWCRFWGWHWIFEGLYNALQFTFIPYFRKNFAQESRHTSPKLYFEALSLPDTPIFAVSIHHQNHPTMMKSIVFCCCLLALSACSVFSTLTSTTEIGPQNSFILGQNQHGAYHVNMKNISNHTLQVRLTPSDGNPQPLVNVKSREKVSLKVDRNTKLEVINDSPNPAKVELLVNGDTGLSMGYKN